ncbi:MAG: hypothetical protein J1E29_05230 [Duncaniella sp.]|nr:hypothetical protein [Duncaniella sp.]
MESVNSSLTALRYPRLKAIAAAQAAITNATRTDGITFSIVTTADAEELSLFLTSMPDERVSHFNPHPFDVATLRRMARGSAFVMWKVTDASGICVGYNFLRCFFNGKSFHGLAVAANAEGRGIGGDMWALGARTAAALGLTMRATISESNLPSLRSCRRATDCSVIDRLDNNYILVECRPKIVDPG